MRATSVLALLVAATGIWAKTSPSLRTERKIVNVLPICDWLEKIYPDPKSGRETSLALSRIIDYIRVQMLPREA